MPRTATLLLGVVTVIPALWIVVWFGYLIFGFVSDGPWPAWQAMSTGMAAVVVLTVALAVFYGRHAWRNERLREDERVTWTIFVTLLSAFAQPVYWYLYLWRPPEDARRTSS